MAWIFIPKCKTKYRDAAGQNIDFEKPYFDQAFRRTFNTAEEKATFMNEIGAINAGDSWDKYKKEKKIADETILETSKDAKKQWKKEI